MSNVDVQLARLESADLVRRADVGELADQFKHALTQESAYESLLKSQRAELHRRVAQAYEELYTDRLDEFVAQLALHSAAAGDDAKTLEYATRAGDVVAQRFANAEARLNYSKALESLSRLPDDAVHRRIHVGAIIRFVSVSLRSEGSHRSLARLEDAEKLAQELYGAAPATRNDRLRLARVRYWMAQGYLHANQPREAIRYLQEVLSVTQAEGDDELRAIPESMMGRAFAVQGRFADAEPHLRTATQSLDELATNHEAVLARGMLEWVLAARGDYAAGLAEGERARVAAVQASSLTGMALSGMSLCQIALAGGDMTRLLETSRETLRAAEKADDQLLLYVGYAARAWAESRLGNHTAASESMAKSNRISQRSGGRLVFADVFAAASAEIALNAGRAPEALALAEQTVKSAQTMEDVYAQGLAHRVWGEALARLDPPQYDSAQTHFAKSLLLFEEGDACLEAARTHLAWGKILHERADNHAARGHFERAAAQFQASGLTRELYETQRFLVDSQ